MPDAYDYSTLQSVMNCYDYIMKDKTERTPSFFSLFSSLSLVLLIVSSIVLIYLLSPLLLLSNFDNLVLFKLSFAIIVPNYNYFFNLRLI